MSALWIFFWLIDRFKCWRSGHCYEAEMVEGPVIYRGSATAAVQMIVCKNCGKVEPEFWNLIKDDLS